MFRIAYYNFVLDLFSPRQIYTAARFSVACQTAVYNINISRDGKYKKSFTESPGGMRTRDVGIAWAPTALRRAARRRRRVAGRDGRRFTRAVQSDRQAPPPPRN